MTAIANAFLVAPVCRTHRVTLVAVRGQNSSAFELTTERSIRPPQRLCLVLRC